MTTTTYTATGLTADTVYSFKVKARNIVGFSAESSSISIRAATVPITPIAPVTSIQGSSVRVTWTPPDNGGSPITAYRIEVRQVDDTTYSVDSTDCNGSDSVTKAAGYCDIPIATLRASPFSHDWGADIYAKIIAINLVGESIESPAGNGAIILTTPDKPLSLENALLVTNAIQIGLSWTEGTLNGGATVLDYRIYYDQGTDTYAELTSGVTATTFTSLEMTSGTTYKFKV